MSKTAPESIHWFRRYTEQHWPVIAVCWAVCRYGNDINPDDIGTDSSYRTLRSSLRFLKEVDVKHHDKRRLVRTLVKHHGYDSTDVFKGFSLPDPTAVPAVVREYLTALDGIIDLVSSQDGETVEEYMRRVFPRATPWRERNFNVGPTPVAGNPRIRYDETLADPRYYGEIPVVKVRFTTPCSTTVNTPHLNEKLESIGYKMLFSARNGLGKRLNVWDGFAASADEMPTGRFIDCGDNEELFIALASLREGTDYGQWFTNGEEWYLYSLLGPIRVLDDTWHKATADEIIEHFTNTILQ